MIRTRQILLIPNGVDVLSGTYCPATGHHIAQRGVTNVLRNFGCLIDEPPTTREALGLPPTTIVFADQYIPAPVRGFWETAVDPGERVKNLVDNRSHAGVTATENVITAPTRSRR